MIRFWHHQLRVRLVLGFVLVVIANTWYMEYNVRQTLNDELPQVQLRTLTTQGVQLQQQFERAVQQGTLSSDQLAEGPLLPFRLYSVNGAVLEDRSPVPREHTQTFVQQAFANHGSGPQTVTDGDERYGFEIIPIHRGTQVVGALEVAQVLPPIDQFQQKIQGSFVTTAVLSLSSVLAFCVYLGVRISQSLAEIEQQTTAIVRGDFSQRIPIRSNDELGQIARCINQMAEDLDRLARTRNEFLSKVSHELRTPLTIAKGFTSMLTHGNKLPEQERTIGVIDGQIDDLTRLVGDLLDLSRRQNSKLDLSIQTIDCAKFMAELQEQHAHVLRGRQINLTVQLHAVHVFVEGDRQRLYQVFGNLIGNASRYSRGNIWLTLDADAQDAILAVRDDGPGIAPDDQIRIFEPFFQSRHGARGQAGLGLTVARELILGHGGTISVESALDIGTTFFIRLPRVLENGKPHTTGRLRLPGRRKQTGGALATAELQLITVAAPKTHERMRRVV